MLRRPNAISSEFRDYPRSVVSGQWWSASPASIQPIRVFCVFRESKAGSQRSEADGHKWQRVSVNSGRTAEFEEEDGAGGRKTSIAFLESHFRNGRVGAPAPTADPALAGRCPYPIRRNRKSISRTTPTGANRGNRVLLNFGELTDGTRVVPTRSPGDRERRR